MLPFVKNDLHKEVWGILGLDPQVDSIELAKLTAVVECLRLVGACGHHHSHDTEAERASEKL